MDERTPPRRYDAQLIATVTGRAAEALGRYSMDGIEGTTRDGSVWETNAVPHELQRLFARDTFLWGGDLNCDPRWMTARPSRAATAASLRSLERGLARCPLSAFTTPTSKRSSDPKTDGYQLDHVFVDKATERRLTGWT